MYKWLLEYAGRVMQSLHYFGKTKIRRMDISCGVLNYLMFRKLLKLRDGLV